MAASTTKPPNGCVHLPGRLQRRSVSENQSAGPVKCNAWFAGDPSSKDSKLTIPATRLPIPLHPRICAGRVPLPL